MRLHPLWVQHTRSALPGYRRQAIGPGTASDVAAILLHRTACIPCQAARGVECNSVALRRGKSVPQGSWLGRDG